MGSELCQSRKQGKQENVFTVRRGEEEEEEENLRQVKPKYRKGTSPNMDVSRLEVGIRRQRDGSIATIVIFDLL
jgi:hypothetical protein